MASYSPITVTTKGLQLLAKITAGEVSSLHITTAKSSDYVYPDGTDFAAITSQQGIKQTVPVSNVSIDDDYNVRVMTLFTNIGLNYGYTIQNIGVYAVDPDESQDILFMIVHVITDPNTMPSQDQGYASALINFDITVAGTVDVDQVVDPSGIVLREELENYVENQFIFHSETQILKATTPDSYQVIITLSRPLVTGDNLRIYNLVTGDTIPTTLIGNNPYILTAGITLDGFGIAV